MDAGRFDSLTRTLTLPGSRRRALVAVLGGTLGLRGLTETNQAAAKNCKKIENKKKRN
jgi:hypothetical protein